eukprot:gnl/TRDRNA2_/TRDRNA2_172633_c0_seq8.p1 gnl/TRDRNA2_/TRDRNA2_172633_c0~~gnl/TRDRNA2_/TRDRNA2_172633_c0_seq8.p1  ORF type:complete len:288 (+),score=44.13 gnl/TRDRNA2_/TRDRNA2_172633_c0_seq8:58-921(+)
MGEPTERDASRSPPPRRDKEPEPLRVGEQWWKTPGVVVQDPRYSGESCFTMNARWWRTPGALSVSNPLSDYDRDRILKENPLAGQLVELNQHVITCESQDSRLDMFVPVAEWYTYTKRRRKRFAKLLDKHQLSNAKVANLQRTFVEMVCESEEQARKIIDAVKDFCWYVLTHRDGTQECSSIFDDICIDALPLSATLFPPLKPGDENPFHVVNLNMFLGVGASELDDIVSRKESTHCTLPAQFCHLTVCTKHFGQSVPSGFIVPDALLLGARCSQVLTASATHASEH